MSTIHRTLSLRALTLVVFGFVAAGCGASGGTEHDFIDELDAGELDGSLDDDASGGSGGSGGAGGAGGAGGSEEPDASVEDAGPDGDEPDADPSEDPDAGDGGDDVESDAGPDADTPDAAIKGALELCVLNAGGPFDLCQTPEELDFEIVPAGMSRMRSFRIDNETLENVTFESATAAHGDYSVVAVRHVFDPDEGDTVREVVALPTTRSTGPALHFEVTFTARGEIAGPVPADEVVVKAQSASGDPFEIIVPIVGEQEACAEGFAACDADWTNGCETDIDTDASHCGQCGNACSFAHASAVCNQGTCEIAACVGGYDDCNGLDADGCEIDTQTDVNHCGACNAACPEPEVSDWSACHSALNECAKSGIQRRTITTYTCVDGGCVPNVTEETASCQRNTEGMVCGGGVVEGPWSECSRNSSNICDPGGTQSRTVTTQSCQAEMCVPHASVEHAACVMPTTGCHRFTSDTEVLTQRGKVGANIYSSECPSGSVAVGMFLVWGTRMDQMTLICAAMNPDGTLGAAEDLDPVGGTGGHSSATLLCEPGHVMVGLHGKVSNEVTMLGPKCAPLTEWATSGTGSYLKGPSGNNTGTTFEDTCSDGVITRIDGYYGNWCSILCYTVVQSVQGTCTKVTVDP